MKRIYVKLVTELIKEYEKYFLYQVYGVNEVGERIPLYKECVNRR